MIYDTYYLNKDIKYMISRYIYEYDMSKANISVLYAGGIINKDEYNYYYNLPKSKREVEIGIRRKDREFDKTLSSLIQEYRIRFIKENNIPDEKILSIKNDALFIIDKEPSITKFDNVVEFVQKNKYTSYYNLNNLEIYYSNDSLNEIITFDVKGISDNKLNLHLDYFIDFLYNTFEYFESKDKDTVLRYIDNFYNKYIRRELDIGYYREFNSSSEYSLYSKSKFFKFQIIDPKLIDKINISCNQSIIRDLYSIAASEILNKN